MEQPNIKILTPCFGGQVQVSYMHSIINFYSYARQNGINFSFLTLPGCSLISLGRSMMLKKALEESDWTHVMWIDADIEFEPQCIHSMILDDKDIIGGLYPKKDLPIDFASSPMPNGEHSKDSFETIYVATGFMLVKRDVILKMYEHYREELEFQYQGTQGIVHLFDPIIDESGTYLTEDYAFCKRARDMGYKCYMSNKFELPHTGTFSYSAAHENRLLDEYVRRGRITINEDNKVNYFSVLEPNK